MNIMVENPLYGYKKQKPKAHKYVNKKLVNGKWRYYYTKSETSKHKETVANLQKIAKDAERKEKLYDSSSKGFEKKYKKSKKLSDKAKSTLYKIASKYNSSKKNKAKNKLTTAYSRLQRSAKVDSMMVGSDERFQLRNKIAAQKALETRKEYLKKKKKQETINKVKSSVKKLGNYAQKVYKSYKK